MGGVRELGRWWPAAVLAMGVAVVALGIRGALSERDYAVLTDGLQAIGVVLALGLGAATLRRDSHDRRVDRVLALHQELMTGDLWGARHRLAAHLRGLGKGSVKPLTREELRTGEGSIYEGLDVHASPVDDVDLLLRFFERANAARAARAVDEALLAELVGVHAIWWNRAVVYDDSWMTRGPLDQLSRWFDHYVASCLPARDPRRTKWLSSNARDFPPLTD